MPSSCPVCGSPVVKEGEEKVVRCVNSGCPAKVRESLKHFGSKGAMNIEGLGEKILIQLLEKGMIEDEADIYSLRYEDLIKLDKIEDRSANNLLSAIERSKKTTLAKFIYALGIRHVGEHVAQILSSHFENIQSLQNAGREELEMIEGIGPQIAESTFAYFQDEENRRRMTRILDSGMEFKKVSPPSASTLTGKSFLITGRLSAMNRSEAKDVILKKGGRLVSQISRNTDYLVAGESPGSKLAKARDLGVVIIDEEAFLKLIA